MAEDSDDDGVKDVTPGLASPSVKGGAEGALLSKARDTPGSPETSEDEEWHAFSALGGLNLHPGSVGSIFADQAERERRAGLDVAAQVWATTKQLLGEDPTAYKLLAALAASKRQTYLVVMKGDQFFTLVHHLTMLDVELRPRIQSLEN